MSVSPRTVITLIGGTYCTSQNVVAMRQILTGDSWKRSIQACDSSYELHFLDLVVMWSNL
ncbi:hypothetical protein E2C01_008445 [Portunus trituberculatus]|uniref:Uncharacterized protein n=1 Tax=Portunus trituberculatus TaxID=210409 RepID=A0A5B7D4M3_PORTR|nr:hypothetical protein [Portunus trituberculatus]